MTQQAGSKISDKKMQKIQKEFREKLMYSCFVEEDRDTDQVQNLIKKYVKLCLRLKMEG